MWKLCRLCGDLSAVVGEDLNTRPAAGFDPLAVFPLPLATLTCSVAVETNPPYSLVLTSCPALCLAMYPITIGVALTAYP